MDLTKTSNVRVRGSTTSVISGKSLSSLVDRKPFLTSFMCPFAVPTDLLRCLRTVGVVRPGKVVKFPAEMAATKEETTGLQADW